MNNFTGVTFAQQKVLPSDDAIIRRSILSDGILYGCERSYSGSTLTMGAGQLLICGRQIRHPSAQNWAVADATSGFARLVLTVDLTRTASKEVFEQVVDSIEYATSQDGFPELNQSDVNTTGSVYQVAACVVSLGTGGITGIVSQLGPCEISGGGGLNFKLVGGLTQPADPTKNTIWVPTDFEITGYEFSATEPADTVDGMVWIPVGTSSTVAFNALKKNGIMVYPLSAKQYVNGAWVSVKAKSYQNGNWVDWWDGGLFANGNQYESVTGGWSSNGCVDPGYTVISATIGQTIRLQASSGKLSIACTEDMINLSEKEKLVVNLSQRSSGILYVGITKNKTNIYDEDIAVLQASAVGIHELTIPANAGGCYVYAGLWTTGDLQVSEIKAV